MRVIRYGLAVAFLALAGCATLAQDRDTVEQLQSAAVQDGTALELVRSLTAEIGPRFAGSTNDAQARIWAEQKMREIGLSSVRSEEFALDSWQRGLERASVIAPTQRTLVIAGIGRTVGTHEGGIIAPLQRIASMKELSKLPDDSLVGKIAFVDGAEFMPSRLGEGFAAGSNRIRHAASESARLGALAVLVRSALSGNARVAHAGLLSYAPDVPKIPAAVVSNPDADALRALLEGERKVTINLELQPRQASSISGNVIGEIMGTDLADEIVLLGAHLDSWDLGEGALDDGAGVAIMLSVAKLISQLPDRPRRTIRIALFGAEEVSLGGARRYAEIHGHERHAIGIESDYGAGAIWGFYSNVPTPMLPAMDQIQTRLAPLGIERGHNYASGGEDLTYLRGQGMPVASLVQDATDYFDVYHSPNDSFAMIDPVALRQNVAAFATFAWLAANLPFDRTKTDLPIGAD